MSGFLKTLKAKRITFGPVLSILILLLCSFVIYLGMAAVSPFSTITYIKLSIAQPLLFLLNYLPIFLFMAILFSVYSNAIFTSTFSATFFLSLGLINRVKIQMRQDPLLPTDVTLLSEITSLLDKFNSSFVFKIAAVIVIALFVLLLSIIFFKHTKIHPIIRVCVIFFSIIIGYFANTNLYSSDKIYDSFQVEGNYYFKVNHYLCKGFLFSFVYDFNTRHVQKPIQYSSENFINLDRQEEEPIELINQKKPHIIMVMGEAFSDISINKNIHFENYADPLENYKQITGRDDVISGHVVVPSFGGGTSDTEFDVLTACPTAYIDNTLPSYNFVRRDFDGLPRRLKEIGYETLAIHPGNSWFYNRINVYDYFGFNEFLYLEKDFDLKTQSIAGYITEEATMDKMISSFEEHIQTKDSPLFQFCVTIQNHGPYTDKYWAKKNFESDIPLSEEETNILSNYFYGLSDADKQIGRLFSYFEQSDEPVVFVYFGDHLPGFPGGLELFKKLEYGIDIDGTIEERINLYKTPFFIWENEAAKEIVDIQKNMQNCSLSNEEITMNASFLGATLTELLGYENISPFFTFVNELRKEYPVVTNQGYMDANGNYTQEISNRAQECVDTLKGWVYYKLFEQVID